MTNAPPSVNPANEGNLVGMLREVLGKFLNNVDDMLPARVVAYDRDTNLAQVKPLIMMVTSDNQKISRAPIAAVPVFQIGAGGFMLNYNLQPGDLGFIKANDRDISLFMQSFAEARPNTYRKHSFNDGVFFPAVLSGYTIAEEDEENVVLQTLDGTQRIAIWPDRVKITSDSLVIIDSPLTTFTGNIGAVDLNVSGTITAAVDVIAGENDVSLVHHVHSGVVPGGGNTGEPV